MSVGVNILPDDQGRGAYIQHAIAATPSNTTTYPQSAGVYVGGTGDLAVTLASGAVVTFKTLSAGLYPISVTKVMATNTTATDVLVVY